MSKKEGKGYEDQKYDYILLKIQTNAFIVMIICTVSISIVHRFLHWLFPYELAVFIISGIVGFGIGSIWLKRDFLRFKDGYLKHLDHEKQEKLEKEKAKLIRKGKKNERKNK